MRSRMYAIAAVLLIIGAVYTCHATGALYIRPLNSSQTYALMSIKSYDATVEIQDQIAVTHIDQRFFNQSSTRVESTFIFPLPDGAVITELIYWFNGRKYQASLREREDAQKAYDTQIRKQIDPALLQYFGENTFKLNIAPIDPKSEVRFEITYAELLPYEFGRVDYRFLLNTTGLSPEPLDRVSVQIDAVTNKRFKMFYSPTHGNTPANHIDSLAPDHYSVNFGDEHFTSDKDLIVRFSTRQDGVDMTVRTYVPSPQDSFGVDGFYALWITPPDTVQSGALPERNIVFTADVSSSMEGPRIEQLRQALTIFLESLSPEDRFNIVIFSTAAVRYRPDLVRATPEEIASARAFVASLGAVGLTNIDEALHSSLDMSFGDTTNNVVVFMTDGYPTWGEVNSAAIVDSVRSYNAHGVRLFTFGIGDEVSRALLSQLAEKNGGYATYISSDDSISVAIEEYFRRAASPVMENMSIGFGGLSVYDVFPRSVPELFWGGQLLQFGRYRDGGTHLVTLQGDLLRKPFSLSTTVDFARVPGGNRAVARLWAKTKIDYLLAEIAQFGENKELVDAVIDLSIRYGVLTPYTAFYVDPNAPTAVPDEVLTARRLSLMQNYPNPFTERTTIRFSVPPDAGLDRVTVTIYDIVGRPIRTLYSADATPGNFTVTWDGTDEQGRPVPAGAYICRLVSGAQQSTRTLLLAR